MGQQPVRQACECFTRNETKVLTGGRPTRSARWTIFEVSDAAVDSAVLLDGFPWMPCVVEVVCHHDPCPPIICPP